MIMKRNILAIGLAIGLIIPTYGCAASDADSDAWKQNTGTINLSSLTCSGNGISVDGKKINITSGGDFEVSGTLDGGMIYINSEEKVKLRLSGASITSTDGPAIYFDNAKKALITITENTENYLTDSATYSMEDADATLFSNDDLEIKGSGKLTVSGVFQHGIAGDDDVVIENGDITINSVEHCIKANDLLSVSGGNITCVSETGKGMKAELDLVVDNGDINITSKESEGIESKGTLTINGGNISINAKDDGINTGNADSEENMTAQKDRVAGSDGEMSRGERVPMPKVEMTHGERVPMPDGEMPRGERIPMPNGEMPRGETPPMPDGTGDAENPAPETRKNIRGGFGGFGRMDEETAKAHALTINGGNIYMNINGDGIDSNGYLTINGGTIVIDGPTNAGNGPIDSDGAMTIKGGNIIMASSQGMIQLPQGDDNLNFMRVSFAEIKDANTKIAVKEKQSGEIIAEHSPAVSYHSFIIANEGLKSDAEYEIYVDSELFETVTAATGITTVGTQGGFGGGSRGGKGGMMPGGSRENRVRVSIDGTEVRFDTNPVIKNGTTLVGFRAILEALGAEVSWDESTQTVTASKDGTNIILQIGSTTAKVNGKEKTMLLAPEIINNSTMIPVRFVSEELYTKVEWDEGKREILIYR